MTGGAGFDFSSLLTGAIGAAIGGPVGYWLRSIVDTNVDARKQRRDKITRWRREIELWGNNTATVRDSAVWSEMRPYARRRVIEMIEGGPVVLIANRGDPIKTGLLDDITRIERYWDRPWWRKLPWWDPHG